MALADQQLLGPNNCRSRTCNTQGRTMAVPCPAAGGARRDLPSWGSTCLNHPQAASVCRCVAVVVAARPPWPGTGFQQHGLTERSTSHNGTCAHAGKACTQVSGELPGVWAICTDQQMPAGPGNGLNLCLDAAPAAQKRVRMFPPRFAPSPAAHGRVTRTPGCQAVGWLPTCGHRAWHQHCRLSLRPILRT